VMRIMPATIQRAAAAGDGASALLPCSTQGG
jgi:hypothetical protein